MYKIVLLILFIMIGLHGDVRADFSSDDGSSREQTSCENDLEKYDANSQHNKQLRAEFAAKYEKVLLFRMSTGELPKDDALKAPLFKVQKERKGGFFYLVKGSKALYLFGDKGRWFGRAPKLNFAVLPLSTSSVRGYPQYELSSTFFHIPWETAVAMKNPTVYINESMELGSYGVLKLVRGAWPFHYELYPLDAASSVSAQSPEEVLKQMKGDTTTEEE